jgi:hypothetical protein
MGVGDVKIKGDEEELLARLVANAEQSESVQR